MTLTSASIVQTLALLIQLVAPKQPGTSQAYPYVVSDNFEYSSTINSVEILLRRSSLQNKGFEVQSKNSVVLGKDASPFLFYLLASNHQDRLHSNGLQVLSTHSKQSSSTRYFPFLIQLPYIAMFILFYEFIDFFYKFHGV